VGVGRRGMNGWSASGLPFTFLPAFKRPVFSSCSLSPLLSFSFFSLLCSVPLPLFRTAIFSLSGSWAWVVGFC